MQTDVERSFKREWFARPEVALSAKHSNKSRNQTSMTFLGSLLVDRLAGGKYDLPSLSQLHFGGDEVTGTRSDLAIAQKMDFYAEWEAQRAAKASKVRFSMQGSGAATLSGEGGRKLSHSMDLARSPGGDKLNQTAPL